LAERFDITRNIIVRELDRERMIDPFEKNQSKAAGAIIPGSSERLGHVTHQTYKSKMDKQQVS
jgi:hypothetical protein